MVEEEPPKSEDSGTVAKKQRRKRKEPKQKAVEKRKREVEQPDFTANDFLASTRNVIEPSTLRFHSEVETWLSVDSSRLILLCSVYGWKNGDGDESEPSGDD